MERRTNKDPRRRWADVEGVLYPLGRRRRRERQEPPAGYILTATAARILGVSRQAFHECHKPHLLGRERVGGKMYWNALEVHERAARRGVCIVMPGGYITAEEAARSLGMTTREVREQAEKLGIRSCVVTAGSPPHRVFNKDDVARAASKRQK